MKPDDKNILHASAVNVGKPNSESEPGVSLIVGHSPMAYEIVLTRTELKRLLAACDPQPRHGHRRSRPSFAPNAKPSA